jgi:hypothetical protein
MAKLGFFLQPHPVGSIPESAVDQRYGVECDGPAPNLYRQPPSVFCDVPHRLYSHTILTVMTANRVHKWLAFDRLHKEPDPPFKQGMFGAHALLWAVLSICGSPTGLWYRSCWVRSGSESGLLVIAEIIFPSRHWAIRRRSHSFPDHWFLLILKPILLFRTPEVL